LFCYVCRIDLRSIFKAYLHAHMRQKTNTVLRRIQSVRPETKKNFRRGASATTTGKNKNQVIHQYLSSFI